MALRKCPKCELNYIRDGAEYCDVCMRAMKRAAKILRHDEDEEADEITICTECGEAPVVPGKELCIECLKEQKRQAQLEIAADAAAPELGADLDDDLADEDADGPLTDEDGE